jgi:hypothetical protein
MHACTPLCQQRLFIAPHSKAQVRECSNCITITNRSVLAQRTDHLQNFNAAVTLVVLHDNCRHLAAAAARAQTVEECSGCGNMVAASAMREHTEAECAQRAAVCPNAALGCTCTVPACELQAHLRNECRQMSAVVLVHKLLAHT